MTEFQVIGIVARHDRKKALKYAERVVEYLESKGVTLRVEENLARLLGREREGVPLEKMKTDLIVTIGGDGTILNTCLGIPKPEPPLLTINMGVRGFLTEVKPSKGLEALERCLKGDYRLERSVKLASFIGKKRLPDALNEVYITSKTLAKLLYVRVWRDGIPIAKGRADGFVIASQTGSTGYSLSAGGPILDPLIDGFVLTPVCPLTIFHPIVFSSSSTVKLEILKPKEVSIVVDGHYQFTTSSEERFVKIVKSEHTTSFIRFNGGFYDRLRARLLFSRGGRI